jgi:hypothetical protein
MYESLGFNMTVRFHGAIANSSEVMRVWGLGWPVDFMVPLPFCQNLRESGGAGEVQGTGLIKLCKTFNERS